MANPNLIRWLPAVAGVLRLVVSAADATFPKPAKDVKPAAGKQTAVLVGGCFWCRGAVVEIMGRVENVISGYSGRTKETAKCDIIPTGRTAHGETILITGDPTTTSYGREFSEPLCRRRSRLESGKAEEDVSRLRR